MPVTEKTYYHQKEFADSCLSGQFVQIDGVRPERLETYRNLVYGNLSSNLKNAYPIASKLLGEDVWSQLIHDFVAEYHSNTPYLWQMPKGFWEWAVQKKLGESLGYPFLEELIHFEWMEIELFMMPDQKCIAKTKEVTFDSVLTVNPESRILRYQYPVFKKASASITENDLGVYFLFAYRHPETLQVHFMELSPFYALMLQVMKEHHVTARSAAESASDYLQIEQPIEETQILSFLEESAQQQIIL